MIREVTMYRVECDEDGCDASPQDEGEFHAWADTGMPVEEAQNADWIVRDGLHLCLQHGSRTVCMGNDQECPRRDVTEAEDGWMYCPDHRRAMDREGA